MKSSLFLILFILMSFSCKGSLPEDVLSIQKIDSLTFWNLKAKVGCQEKRLEVITNIEKAAELLEEVVGWGFIQDDGSVAYSSGADDVVCFINFRNKDNTGMFFPEADYLRFVAYYPKEDILILEGDNSSIFSINLTTGQQVESIDNPAHIVFSPQGGYGLYSVYCCGSSYHSYIQKKIDAQYTTIISLNSELYERLGSSFYYIADACWSDEQTLNFSVVTSVSEDSEPSDYYQLKLK